jgi:tubulin-specific chaperone E
VKELTLAETLLEWTDIVSIASNFPSLSSLNAGTNQLTFLPTVDFSSISTTLTSLNLEYNNFTSLANISSLTSLTSLRNLHLKGNNISTIASTSLTTPFARSLQYLDISYNKVQAWSFIDGLPAVFPGLTALRFAHNPIYDNPDPDNVLQGKALADEAHMITVGRLAKLKTLNFVTIADADRANAEMFYLSRIAKQMASVPEENEEDVIAQHGRYYELCHLYGKPDVIRSHEINASFLEARLITCDFRYNPPESNDTTAEVVTKTTKLPKSFDIYAVKGIAGKLFDLPPLKLKLVWETGEWDPVAGFDEEVGDSSEEEAAEEETEREGIDGGEGANYRGEKKVGRWVKREVELKDSPRQLGFCVDGLEAKIRLETR